MNRRPPLPLRRERALTLIEVLAATSVLTLLLVVVVQMINSVVAVTSGTTRHLDADSQVRLAFDRMAVDLAQIVKRADVDYYLQKNTGDDQMAFYSETSGYYPSGVTGSVPKSNAALVGYRINANRQLERLNKALVWNGVTSSTAGAGNMTTTTGSMRFLPQTLTGTWQNISGNSGTDTDYQVIGESVFRMEICYLVRNATTPAKLSDTPYLPAVPATPAPTATPYPTPYNGLRDVADVVVTLAVLDDTSRLIVQPADLNAAAGILADANGATLTNTPGQAWQAKVDNGGLIGNPGSGLSKRAASNVRIYERYFSIGNTQ